MLYQILYNPLLPIVDDLTIRIRQTVHKLQHSKRSEATNLSLDCLTSFLSVTNEIIEKASAHIVRLIGSRIFTLKYHISRLFTRNELKMFLIADQICSILVNN